MKEKDLNSETNQSIEKLAWEAPKLYCLDKGKTEGGSPGSVTTEGFTYYPQS